MGFFLIFNRYVFNHNVKKCIQTNAYKFSSTAALQSDESTQLTEKVQLGARRDMSKLLRQNRNMLLHVMPYNEPCSWIHLTEKYKSKIFGRYGLASGVDPYVCFSMRGKSEFIENAKEPYSLQQLILNGKSCELNRKRTIENREHDVSTKLEKLEQLKVEMRNKIVKKETDALVAKAQKQRLMEEVRRHFGFKVDPRDERFKEMLEQKEREERKKQKEAKRKAKEDRMVAKLADINLPTH